MIDLSRKYDLEFYASFWAGKVYSFLTTKLTNEVWVKRDGKRIYFETRFKKYRFSLSMAFTEHKVGRQERRRILEFYNEAMKDPVAYIKSNESQLKTIASTYFENPATKFSKDAVSALKDVMVGVYEGASNEFAYDLFEAMDIRTCPYCNRQYTFTIKKDSKSDFIVRPEMDHCYDKSDYPLLALCFYNLVPSCHDCNHGKGKKSVSINPYFRGFKTKFVICSKEDNVYNVSQGLNREEVGKIKDTDDFNVGFNNTTKEEQDNIRKLGLAKLYNEHRDYVMEIVEKASTYDEWLSSGLVDSFQGLEHSPASVYDFVWGKYFDDAEQVNRPLSKLTKDILDQLNIKR